MTERPARIDEPARPLPAAYRDDSDWRELAAEAMRGTLDALRALPGKERGAHRARIERTVAARLAMFDELSALDNETRTRIRPVVKCAEEVLAGRAWTLAFLRWSDPSFAIVVVLRAALWLSAAWLVISGLGDLRLSADALSNAIVIAGVVLIVRQMALSIMWHRLRPVMALITVALLMAGAAHMGWWSGPVVDYLAGLHMSASGNDPAHLRAVDWPAAVRAGVWVAATITAFGLVSPTCRFIYERVIERSTYRRSSAVVQTALLLNEFLFIARTLEATVRDDDHHVVSYLAGEDRRELVNDLGMLARQVRGPWAKSLRTGHRSVDAGIAQLADGIATAILRWQLRAAQGGPHLEDMRKAFATGVVNIADSEWHLLAAAETAPSPKWQRRAAQLIKRSALIPLPLLASLLLTKYFPMVPAKYDGPIVALGALSSVAYLMATLDEKFSAVLASANSLTQTIRK